MKRKASKQSRGPNAAEKAFQGWIKQQRCCTCGNEPVHVHHCAGSSYRHNKTLIGHWFCIPLCDECHDLRHQHKSGFRHLYGPECSLWVSEYRKYVEAKNPKPVDCSLVEIEAIMDTNL